MLAGYVLKFVILLTEGVFCADANVPYRLMRSEAIKDQVGKIPTHFSLANIALAVLLKKKRVHHGEIKIHFRERYGGEPSVPLKRFGAKALELITQLRVMRQNSS